MTSINPAVADRIRIGDKVSIRCRGKRKIYIAEFWHQGSHRKQSLKTSNKEIARRRAIDIEAKLATGDFAPPVKPISVASAVDDYMQMKKGETSKSRTIVKYQAWLESFSTFCTARGVHTLQQLDAKTFEQYRAERSKTLAAKTMSNGLTIIKQFVKWCSGPARNYLKTNPLVGCKVRKAHSRPAFTPTREQVQLILSNATGDRKLQYAVLAMTGLRAEELVMLRPCDVDLAGGWIHVVGRPGWEPKTYEARDIPIHPDLLVVLNTTQLTDQPYFFCAAPSPKYPNGGHHINPKHLNEDLQKLAMTLKIPVGRKNSGMVVHSFRHYFETQAVDSAVPQFTVDAWMGHAGDNRRMGRQYYGRTDEKSQKYMKQVRF